MSQSADGAEPFDAVLNRFVEGLTRDAAGRQRTDAERDALIAATRDMLGRLSPVREQLGEPFFPNAAFRPNQVVAGVFTVVGLVSRGGMGEIYRARHRELGTDHALKVLPAGFNADVDLLALFHNEARTLLAVRHDAVVGGQGLLRDRDGRPVLVMDFLRGPSLLRTLRHGPLPLPDVLALGARLCAGLGAMHDRAVVHGDISPANVVLVDERAQGATLVDFGLARVLADRNNPYAGLDFAGKYGWASPEQLSPAAALDARSDLYSLGLVLAAASAGEALWMGEDEVVARRQRARVPPLDSVPPPLRSVLARLLQPAPNARPATAAEAGALLAAVEPARPRSLFRRST